MEVYIDDMLVKSITAELHIAHLAEAFQILKKYNMKLNPAKCAFGVRPYFEAHIIEISIEYPMKQVLHKPRDLWKIYEVGHRAEQVRH